MSRRKKKNRANAQQKSPRSGAPNKKRSSAAPKPSSGETRTADVLTIFWTLLVTTAVGCDIGAAIARILFLNQPDNQAIALLSFLLLFAAVVVGLLILALLPLVIRLRKVPPPRGYVVFAILVGVAPILATVVLVAR